MQAVLHPQQPQLRVIGSDVQCSRSSAFLALQITLLCCWNRLRGLQQLPVVQTLAVPASTVQVCLLAGMLAPVIQQSSCAVVYATLHTVRRPVVWTRDDLHH
jgi:hypothetical protein